MYHLKAHLKEIFAFSAMPQIRKQLVMIVFVCISHRGSAVEVFFQKSRNKVSANSMDPVNGHICIKSTAHCTYHIV